MHNSLILGWLLLGSILLFACSKEEYDTRLNSGRQIVLGCSGLWQGETRAVTSNDFCQNIWLAGAYYMDEWSTEVCTPNFMYNQQAVLTASKTGYAFVDDAVWYWPNSGKLRFFAYGPYDQVSSNISAPGTPGAPKLTYTVPNTSHGQYDIQYAGSSEFECAVGSVVNLPFDHLLSALLVEMEDPTVGSITTVHLSGIAVKGTYTPGTGWGSYGSYSNSYTWATPTQAGLLLPQSTSGHSTVLTIGVTPEGKEEQFYEFNLSEHEVAWQPSKIYKYSITISGSGGNVTPEPTSQLNISIAEWEDGAFFAIDNEQGNTDAGITGTNTGNIYVVNGTGSDNSYNLTFTNDESVGSIIGQLAGIGDDYGQAIPGDEDNDVKDFEQGDNADGKGASDNTDGNHSDNDSGVTGDNNYSHDNDSTTYDNGTYDTKTGDNSIYDQQGGTGDDDGQAVPGDEDNDITGFTNGGDTTGQGQNDNDDPDKKIGDDGITGDNSYSHDNDSTTYDNGTYDTKTGDNSIYDQQGGTGDDDGQAVPGDEDNDITGFTNGGDTTGQGQNDNDDPDKKIGDDGITNADREGEEDGVSDYDYTDDDDTDDDDATTNMVIDEGNINNWDDDGVGDDDGQAVPGDEDNNVEAYQTGFTFDGYAHSND